MTDPVHPTDDVLVKLAEGRLHGPELEQLENHLDTCGACRTLLAVVSNGSAPSATIERATLSPGEKLGRYEIERLIGAGGMGMLYVARDPQLGRRVALKLMRPAFNDELGRVRLLREAQAMAQLSHPNVVHVYELGELSGRVFIAMELLEGGTLREWMKTPRTWREVLAMFVAAGDGLYAAHESGVVHRDFKPENVMLGKDGRPRVGDFGLARPELVAEEEMPGSPPMRITQVGAILGTPAYMSPEQLTGKPADALSDQYGFCVALYEALAGKRPFPTDSVAELRQMVLGGMPPPPKDGPVPAHVWAAIARGLHPDPAKRFSSLGELLTVLKLGPEPLALPARRSRAKTAIAVLAAALVSASAGLLFATREPAPLARVAEAPAAKAPLTPVAPVAPVAPSVDPAPQSAEATPEDEPHNRFLPAALELEKGQSRALKARGLQRLAVGDSAIVDIKTVGEDELVLTGVDYGRTTVLAWFKGGARDSMDVTVRPKKAAAAPGSSELSLAVGAQKVLNVPRIQRVAIGDSAIADVRTIGDDQLLVIGMGEGNTTLLTWTEDEKRTSYLIHVHKAAPIPGTVPVWLQPGYHFNLPGNDYRHVVSDTPEVAAVVSDGDRKAHVDALAEGKASVTAERTDGTRTVFLVDVHRDKATVALEEARRAIEAKQWAKAEVALKACLGVEAESIECTVQLASVEARLDHREQSLMLYRKFLQLAPADHRLRASVERILAADDNGP